MNKATYEDLRLKAAFKIFKNAHIYQITGDDSDEYLNDILSKDNEFSDDNSVSYQFALNESGKVLAQTIVYKLEEEFIVISDKDMTTVFTEVSGVDKPKIVETFDKTLIQIEGAKTPVIAQPFYAPYDISTMSFHEVTSGKFEENDIVYSRFGFTGEFGYQFLLDTELVPNFIDTVLSGVPEYDHNLENELYIEVGQPIDDLLYESDYNLTELGYLWNVDFTKENFRGKAALLEQVANQTRQMIGIKSDEHVTENDSVLVQDSPVGLITKVIEDRENGGVLAIAMLSQEYAVSGGTYVTDQGVVLKGISSPYRVPESW